MSLRRPLVHHVLNDAVNDREEFLEAVSGDENLVVDTEKDLDALRGLLKRYESGERVTLSKGDLKTVRMACRCALIWREGFLDSIRGSSDAALMAKSRIEIRQAKAVLVAAGGVLGDPILDNAKSVSLADFMKSDRGTSIRGERVGDVDVRHVSEDGKPLGRIETDPVGVVKVILADGKIVNEPFETAYDAQEWLLRKFSNNLLFSIHRLKAEEAEDAEPDGPRP